MSTADAILISITAFSLLFAVRCYVELYRWARQCQNARIAIAYKRRVQLQAPLIEWLQWANALAGDEASRGRMVYKAGHISVSLLRPRNAGKTHQAILRARRRLAERRGRAPAPALKAGTRSIKLGERGDQNHKPTVPGRREHVD